MTSPQPESNLAYSDTAMGWLAVAHKRVLQKFVPLLDFAPEDFPAGDSLKTRLELRREWMDLSAKQGFQWFVTLQTNQPLKAERQTETVRKFIALVDHFCLGKNWSRWPATERTFYMGLVERGADGNSHIHLLLRMPAKYTAGYMQRTAAEPWKRAVQERFLSDHFTILGIVKGVCPEGDIHFSPIPGDEHDQLAAADYVFKQYRSDSDVILPITFRPDLTNRGRTLGQPRYQYHFPPTGLN